MSEIVIIGAGICGTLTGLLLAEDGHNVTILERDPVGPPDGGAAEWANWERAGVRQFHMGHLFLARFQAELGKELPAVVSALEDAGALRTNPIEGIPASLSGGRRKGDARFELLTGRRPVVEGAVHSVAARAEGLAVRRGVAVKGLILSDNTVPHVDGVVLDDGTELRADLVVDASGRQSRVPRMLRDASLAGPVEEKEDSGFIYYGLTLRSDDGSVPGAVGPLLQHYNSVSTLTLPADNGTWFAAFVATGSDAPMRSVRDVDVFTRAWRAYPLVAHWLDGTPLHEVKAMGQIEDRIVHYLVDGQPVVSGLVPIADAWSGTNPSVGRGASIGLIHAVALRDHLRAQPLADPVGWAAAWHQLTAEKVEPFYRETLIADQHRLGEIRADIAGETYQTDDPWHGLIQQFTAAATSGNFDLLRHYLDVLNVNRLAADVFAEPGVLDQINDSEARYRQPPGPSRKRLLAHLAGTAGGTR